mmetsp:Transcript_10042/g.26686  ORF Transcript_10042/g.26686 Transcript_10042/m.26686 type:complete len:493 (+) Transcript_10042:3-1481(+)
MIGRALRGANLRRRPEFQRVVLLPLGEQVRAGVATTTPIAGHAITRLRDALETRGPLGRHDKVAPHGAACATASTAENAAANLDRAEARDGTPSKAGGDSPGGTCDPAAIASLLQSDPELCRRVAVAVDDSTAQQWTLARAESELDVVRRGVAVPMPDAMALWRLHVRSAIPFVGFGFFDNMIMITAGEAIDATFGVAFGFSTMVAAGLGQMFSDASGITLQGLIERFADKLGLPQPNIRPEQMQLSAVKSFVLASRILGIVFGCLLGMFPLLLIPEKKVHLVDRIAERLPSLNRLEFVSLVTTKTFHDGEVILGRGELSDHVFLVDSGEVECMGRDTNGVPFHVCTITEGQSFGQPQLNCPSHVDLIAKDGDVVVQSISKQDFLRVTGKEGLQVFQETQSPEHAVYFASQGHHVLDTVPEAKRGKGKTRLFASLSPEERLQVLAFTGHEAVKNFNGVPNEGKVRFFAGLSEHEKRDALERWQKAKFDVSSV